MVSGKVPNRFAIRFCQSIFISISRWKQDRACRKGAKEAELCLPHLFNKFTSRTMVRYIYIYTYLKTGGRKNGSSSSRNVQYSIGKLHGKSEEKQVPRCWCKCQCKERKKVIDRDNVLLQCGGRHLCHHFHRDSGLQISATSNKLLITQHDFSKLFIAWFTSS